MSGEMKVWDEEEARIGDHWLVTGVLKGGLRNRLKKGRCAEGLEEEGQRRQKVLG